LTHDLRRCPTCGAYVMTGDNVCPRCDSPLDGVIPFGGEGETISGPAPVDRSQLPTTQLPEVEVTPDPTPLAEQTLDAIDETPLAEPTPDLAESTPDVIDETIVDDTTGVSEAVLTSSAEDTAAQASQDTAEIDDSEQPTAEYIPDERERAASGVEGIPIPPAFAETAYNLPKYVVPPAPYTPPPVRAHVPDPAWITPPPAPVYAPPPVYAYAVDRLQQRVQVYQHGGYHLKNRTSHAATLTHGKVLGVMGWLLAFISIIGVLWYLLLVLLGGFRADRVYITREADGSLFEDGSGAAHVRQKRARIGRRWAIFGSVIFVVCLVLAILLGIAGGIVTSQERYQTALREAYPAVTLFEEQFSHSDADPDDVALVKDGAVAYAILAGIAGVGLWGGATLFVIGTIHAGAYRVSVLPLPGMG